MKFGIIVHKVLARINSTLVMQLFTNQPGIKLQNALTVITPTAFDHAHKWAVHRQSHLSMVNDLYAGVYVKER